VREFKASNPDAITHIRGTSTAKSPHPPTSALSHLLRQHASSYMSSDGHNDLAAEYPAGAIADSPVPFSQEYPVNTPVTVPIPIVDFTTMQPLNAVAPVFSPRPVTASSSASDVATMFRQLRVHTPAPLTPDGQRAADQANDTFVISFTPAERRGDQTSSGVEPGAATGSEATVGAATTTPRRSGANSNGSATPSDLRRCARCGEQNQYCHGHTPFVPNPSLDLPLNPLESQCQDPFRPTAWRDLTSVMRRPRRWQLASPPVLGKTTKMPLRFRQPATTKRSSRGSSPKVSASPPRPLPKGWVYAVEEVGAEVKAEVTDPTLYQITSAPVTCSQLHHAKMLADPHRRLRRASSIIEGRRSSHSASVLTPAVKCRRVTSGPTSTLLTPT
jgi:hypothetical protein